jgi:16S rRNA (guanine527-N7)-methyltransferase
VNGRAAASEIRSAEDFGRAFEVSRETLEKLEVYDLAIRKWQLAVNLVAPATLGQLWHRHFADSAQLVRFVPENARRLVDLGSGGGFPGLVLAILLAEAGLVQVVLVESDQRKAAFLREVARQTGVAVDIIVSRIENTETQSIVGTADVVTARALAPLGRLFSLSKAYFGPGTVGLFLKGREVEQELAEARREWDFDAQLADSLTGGGGKIAVVRHLGAKTEG